MWRIIYGIFGCLILAIMTNAASVAVGQAAPPSAQGGPPQPPVLDAAKFDALDWNAFVLINGLPVEHWVNESGGWEIPPGCQKPGDNTITIVATLQGLIQGIKPTDFSVTLMRDGARGVARQPLAKLTIKAADVHGEVTQSAHFAGQPKAVWGLGSVQQLNQLTLTQKDRDEMYGLLKQQVDAQNKRDVDAYMNSMAFHIKVAVGLNLDASNSAMIRGELAQALARFSKVELKDEKDVQFRVFDRGVLVWSDVKDDQRQTWLTRSTMSQEPKQISYSMHSTFCKVDGKWVMY